MSKYQSKARRASSSEGRTSKIQIRAKEFERDIIDRAADALGKNRTDFILESSVSEAQKVLLEQTVFHLDENAWDTLTAILDAPAKRNTKLEKLLKQSPPWEN
jgi:uncharacterized protein (DUF1778 family)